MQAGLKFKLAVFLTCLALFCTIVTGVVMLRQVEQVLVAERVADFRGIAADLNREIPAAFQTDLSPLLSRTTQNHPGIGVAVFSHTAKRLVAGVPDSGRARQGIPAGRVPAGPPFSRPIPKVTAPRYSLEILGDSRILTYYAPIIRQSQNIGTIVLSQPWSEVIGLRYNFSTTLVTVILLSVLISLAGAYWLSRRVLVDIDVIKGWVERLQYDLTVPFPKVSGDLGEVATAIEEFSASLQTLQEASRSLAGSLYLGEAINSALAMVVRVFGAEHCALLLYDETTQELRVRGSYGLSEEYVQAARVKLGESISGMALLTGKPMSSSDLRWDYPKSLPQLVLVEGMVSQLCAPLLGRGKTIGVLNVYSRTPHVYRTNEITLLCSLANQIAQTIENAQLFEEMETQATTDRLTGLFNQKHLYEMLAACLKSADEDHPVSLLLLDIDFFKTYNDSFGHQAGDTLLQKFAFILRDCVRPEDFVARYGGEEFAIILRGTPVSSGREVAERIRRAVEQYPFHGRECQELGAVTVSVGVSEFPGHAKTTEELIKKADEGLYKAKFTGRNRVEIYYSVLDNLAGQFSQEERTNLEAIKTMLSVISAKDKYTFGHCERVMKYAGALAQALELPTDRIAWITYAAYLHDVGKIEIPWDLLTKPKSLTDQEWVVITQHPVWSKNILQAVPGLKPTFEMVLHHHEWYNGQGYPKGLKGEAIPLGARIIAVADAYDAITSNRLFQGSLPHKQAIEELRHLAGIQFDPSLVELFAKTGIF